MKKQITPTGVKLVRVPLLPILRVRHFNNGTPVATAALIQLLKTNLTLN